MKEPGTPSILGIIGGSGLYDIDSLTDKQWRDVETPFGAPSDQLLFGLLEDMKVVFLPRHGRGHRIPPSEINYRANIYALKSQGVTEILSLSAVGSFKENIRPGTFVIVDQFVDRTFRRESSFFGTGLVAHVALHQPVCQRMVNQISSSLTQLAIPYTSKGTYLVMEGPQFSTRSESLIHRSWGCDVIGMTNMPEAKLAREAEICYATIAMVTDYDTWHTVHAPVSTGAILTVLGQNLEQSKFFIKNVAPMFAGRKKQCSAGCHTALDNCVVTDVGHRDTYMLKKLEVIVKRYLADEFVEKEPLSY